MTDDATQTHAPDGRALEAVTTNERVALGLERGVVDQGRNAEREIADRIDFVADRRDQHHRGVTWRRAHRVRATEAIGVRPDRRLVVLGSARSVAGHRDGLCGTHLRHQQVHSRPYQNGTGAQMYDGLPAKEPHDFKRSVFGG